MKAAHAFAATLALASGMALAQADPSTSPYGARDAQQIERPVDPTAGSREIGDPTGSGSRDVGNPSVTGGRDVGVPSATGSRSVGDPSASSGRTLDPSSTMSNNGDYLEACKQLLGVQAKRDCLSQARRDRSAIESGGSPHGDSMINRP